MEREIKLKSSKKKLSKKQYVFRACNVKHIIKSPIKDFAI